MIFGSDNSLIAAAIAAAVAAAAIAALASEGREQQHMGRVLVSLYGPYHHVAITRIFIGISICSKAVISLCVT